MIINFQKLLINNFKVPSLLKKEIYKKAFTLAEVLIVLGIIGIIAEMTIPTLMQDVQYKANVTALRKAYSVLSQAYTMAVNDNGSPSEWGLTGDSAGSAKMLNILAQYMRVTKNCGNTAGNGCMPSVYNRLKGGGTQGFDSDTGIGKLQLADGSLIAAGNTSATCTNNFGSTKALQNSCGWIYIDVNGFKNPNTIGKDLFLIYITNFGLVPTGTSNDGQYSFPGDCISANPNGWGCSAWVIYNENQDYLKCSNLSWGGNTSCN